MIRSARTGTQLAFPLCDNRAGVSGMPELNLYGLAVAIVGA